MATIYILGWKYELIIYVYYIIYIKEAINNSKSNVRTLKLAKGATKNENVNVMLHWLFRIVILKIIISKDINVSTNIEDSDSL